MLQTELDIQTRLRALEQHAEKRRSRRFDSLSYRDGSAGNGRLKVWLGKLRCMAFRAVAAPRRRILAPRSFTK
jgi:hypothetical protein